MTDFRQVLIDNLETIGSPFYFEKIGNVEIFVVGCKNSVCDATKIAEKINNVTDEHCLVVDTCSIINGRHDLSVELVKLLRALYPDVKLFITGCAIGYNRSDFEQYGICLDRLHKFNIEPFFKNEHIGNEELVTSQNGKTAIIKIQDGCNKNCAYCVEPKINNRTYSVSFDDIDRQIKNAIVSGIRKIQFVGTEMTDYMSDGLDLVGLCKTVLDRYPDIMLSIASLDPGSVKVDGIVELMNNYGNFNKLLYLAVQSLSNDVLKMMRRRHTVERVFEICSKCCSRMILSIDLLVGFPGETEEMFRTTLMNLRRLSPRIVSVLPYSDRKGTDAHEYNNKTPNDVMCRRFHETINTLDEYSVMNRDGCVSARDILFQKIRQTYERDINYGDYTRIQSLETFDDVKPVIDMVSEGCSKFVIDFGNVHDIMVFGVYSQFIVQKLCCELMIDIRLNERIMEDIMSNTVDLYVLIHSEHHIHLVLDDVKNISMDVLNRFRKYISDNFGFLSSQIS